MTHLVAVDENLAQLLWWFFSLIALGLSQLDLLVVVSIYPHKRYRWQW